MINEKEIRTKLFGAFSILKDVYPEFKEPSIKTISFTNSTTYWATIQYVADSSYKLKVTKHYDDIEDVDKRNTRLMSTLIHECIHTIPGCMNHGKKFKHMASLVNNRYPQYNIQRCTSMEDYGIQHKRLDYKYVAHCDDCGKDFHFKKKSRTVQCLFENPHSCTCPCGSHNLSVKSI